MDDEQGPWWTRPPEPDPQARAPHGGNQSSQQAETQVSDGGGYAPSVPNDLFTPAPMRAPVRRVAVPQPPVTSESGGQTETLPAVEDDIFATFSGPIPLVGDPANRTTNITSYPTPDPDGGPDGPPSPWSGDQPRRLPPLKLPEPRVMLLAGAGGLVLLLIVLVALISGGGGGAKSDDPGRTAVAAKATVDTTSEMPGKNPAGLKHVSDAEATALLQKARTSADGSIVEAWTWKDKNGQNLVVTSSATVSGGKHSLRVTHVAKLDTANPIRLRVMKDPNLPANCKGAGTAEFTKNSLIVRDLDSSGIAEVAVGWSSRCGGKDASSQIRLALISNGAKYIIRGQGVIQDRGDSAPQPRASSWPKSYYKTLNQLFHKLYY